MGVRPDAARVNQRRPLAFAHVGRRLAHRAEAGEEIGAVDRIDVKPGKRPHEARDVAARRLHFDGHRNRVTVVLDEEQHRQALGARAAQGLPELAFARRAVAERHVHDLVVVKV